MEENGTGYFLTKKQTNKVKLSVHPVSCHEFLDNTENNGFHRNSKKHRRWAVDSIFGIKNTPWDGNQWTESMECRCAGKIKNQITYLKKTNY